MKANFLSLLQSSSEQTNNFPIYMLVEEQEMGTSERAPDDFYVICDNDDLVRAIDYELSIYGYMVTEPVNITLESMEDDKYEIIVSWQGRIVPDEGGEMTFYLIPVRRGKALKPLQ